MATAEGPSPASCTKLLFTKIPPSVTKDYLINFLECTVPESSIKDADLREQAAAALVTFESHVDIVEVQRICTENPVEGQSLVVQPSDDRGAVLIHKPNSKTTTNCFKYYLGNARRSGGTKNVEIDRADDGRYLIAYYDSKDVALEVSGRKHMLEGHELHLVLFDPNFDKPPSSEDPQSAASEELDSQCSTPAQDLPALQTSAAHPLEASRSNTGIHSSPDITRASEDDYEYNPDAENMKKKELAATKQHRKFVKGLCFAYQNVLDVFSEPISKQLAIKLAVNEDCDVEINGKQHDVEKAEKLLLSLRDNQMSSKYVTEIADKFSRWDIIFSEMDEDFILVQQKEICIGNQSFDDFLEMIVSAKKVSVPPAAEDLLATTAWQQLELDMEEFGNRIEVTYEKELNHVLIVGSVLDLGKAERKVELFLHNSHDTERIDLLSKERDFLQFFGDLEVHTHPGAAEVCFSNNYVEITGLRVGVRQLVHKINEMRSNLRCERAMFNHPKLTTLDESKWERLVQEVSTKNCCIISDLPDPQILDDDENSADWGEWGATVVHSFTVPGEKFSVHVVEGEVKEMKVDAVVQISYSFRPSCGTGASQKSCSSGKEHGTLEQNSEGISVTQSGAWPCKALIHVSLSHYNHDASLTDIIESLMADVYEVCDQHHFVSVALPVIGMDVKVGDGDPPIHAASQVIANFFSWDRRKNYSVQHVFLCSRRAACLRGLTYALQDNMGFPSISSHQDSFRFLASVAERGMRCLKKEAIKIIQGDIAKAKAGVLVVPCDIDIDLDLNKGKITKSLMRGGPAVQSSLQHGDSFFSAKTICERNELLAEDHVVTGSAGSLDAGHIFYVYLPPWGCKVKKMLTERVNKCLKMASEKKCRTVAMTALGIGKLGYPPQFVARTLFSVVSKFMEQENNNLEGVIFVIFPSDHVTFEAFKKEYREWMKFFVARTENLPPLVYPHPKPAVQHGSVGRGRGSGHQYSYPLAGQADHHNAQAMYSDPGHQYSYLHAGQAYHHNAQAVYSNPGHQYGDPHPGQSDRHNAQPAYSKPELLHPEVYYNVTGDISLCVKLGNIIYERCDVAVNSINKQFDFDRANKKAMEKKGLVITSPGALQCKKILHMSLDDFKQNPKGIILKGLIHILDKVPDCHSVAFPALGTGALNAIEPGQLITHMLGAIKDLKKPKRLKEVRIIAPENVVWRLVSQLDVMLSANQNKSGESCSGAHKKQITRGPAQPFLSTKDGSILMTKVRKSDRDRKDVRSVFIFSDSKDRRIQASFDIASGIGDILGPILQDEQKKERDSQSQDSTYLPYFPWGCWY